MDAQGYVTPREVRDALRTLYCEDSETNLQSSLLRIFSDDLKPVDNKGRWRPSSLLVLTMGILAVLCGIFLCFTFGGPR